MIALKIKSLSKYIIPLIYVTLFILISLYVFVANDESQPIIEIFQWSYLIPVLIYSSGAISLSLILFLLFKKKVSIVISLVISIIIGLPIGLLLVAGFFNLISSIN